MAEESKFSVEKNSYNKYGTITLLLGSVNRTVP